MRAFISSRTKELEPEREIAAETLLSMGFEVAMWEKTPATSKLPREVFLKEVERSQIFILILWKEYSENVVEEFNRARRMDIPILAFVKKIEDDEKRQDELSTFISERLQYRWKEFRKLKELRERLREAVMTTLFEHFKKPFLSHTRKELYELGEDIALSARRRVVLLARSLILITGPRPYMSDDPIFYEKTHHETLSKLVEKARKGDIAFSAGYLINPTKEEIALNPNMKEYVKKNLSYLLLCTQEVGSKFSLLTPPLEWNPPFTFIIGDNRFAIWFKDPMEPETYACISSEDKVIADALVHIFTKYCKSKSLDVLCEELIL